METQAEVGFKTAYFPSMGRKRKWDVLDGGAVRKVIASILRAKQIIDIALDLLTLRGTAIHQNKNRDTYSISTYMCTYAQQLITPPPVGSGNKSLGVCGGGT